MIAKVIIFATIAAVALAIEVYKPQPYSFGYTVKDKHGEKHRQETGDGVSGVKGSYGFTDDRGVLRQVNYVADKLGFRAQVKTNEPGTANQNPAAVVVQSSALPGIGGYGVGGLGAGVGLGGLGYGGVGLGGLGYGGLGYGGVGYGGVGYGGLGYGGLGYGGVGYGGLGYGGVGLGYGRYGGVGLGYGGYGLY